MNARTDISVLAHENRDYSAIRESSARAHAAILSPVMTTVSVVREIGDFEEVIAAARASVAHSLAIAKARRFFSDRDASQAVSEAEQFDLLVEKQIAAIQNLAEVRNLLTDLASEPARQSAHRGENVPGWTLLLASRAGALLRAIWQ